MMNQLPSEVRSRIFDYLSCGDRNVARLVCRTWYQECTTKSIQLNEKFTVDNVNNVYQASQQRKMLQWLETCGRQYLNLEFRATEFQDHSISLWQNCGPSIYSLGLIECSLPKDTFIMIVKSCPNLNELTLLDTRLSVDLLNELVREQVTNMSVQSLRINKMSAATLHTLLTVFPNVTKVTSDNEEWSLSLPEVACSCLLCATVRYSVVSSAGQMRAANRIDHKKKSIESISDTARFKSVTLNVGQTNFNAVLQFLNSQPTLEEFHCRVNHFSSLEYDQYSTRILQTALDGCPNLHTFRLKSDNGIFWSTELFNKLAASRIQTLDFDCGYHAFDEPELSRFNENLSRLSLKYAKTSAQQQQYTPSRSTKLLLRAFCNLKYLCLFSVTQEVLHMVCLYQTNLRALRIAGNDKTFGPFQVDVDSFNKLRLLEELIVDSEIQYLQLTSELAFPNLKCICMGTEEPIDWILDSLGQMPRLEIIILKIRTRKQSLTINDIASLCSRLNRLKYLRIYGEVSQDIKFPRDELEKIFRRCSPLRILTCGPVFYFKYCGVTGNEIHTKRWTYLLDPREIFVRFGNHFENYTSFLKMAMLPRKHTEVLRRSTSSASNYPVFLNAGRGRGGGHILFHDHLWNPLPINFGGIAGINQPEVVLPAVFNIHDLINNDIMDPLNLHFEFQ